MYLYSLVELYVKEVISFSKEVRLSSWVTKSEERLVNPMENSLDLITSGRVSQVFFLLPHWCDYRASSSTAEDTNILNLRTPSIINWCQTIVISNEYLRVGETENETSISFQADQGHC